MRCVRQHSSLYVLSLLLRFRSLSLSLSSIYLSIYPIHACIAKRCLNCRGKGETAVGEGEEEDEEEEEAGEEIVL